MTTRTVDALVARVLDDYQIAINAGSDQGVTEGSTVTLYRQVSVQDPVTKEELGGIQLPKLRMRVNHVQSKLCAARVVDRVSSEGSPLLDFAALRPLLQVVQSDRPRDDSPAGKVFVALGEPVRIIVSDENDVDEELEP